MTKPEVYLNLCEKKKEQIDNKIGDFGVRMINEALKANSTLTTLYLHGERGKKINE